MFTFLTSTAFRWLFGEIIGFFKAKQEHAQQMDMMRLSMTQEEKRAELQRQAVKEAADAGVKVIEAQAAATASAAADQMFLKAVEGTSRPSGVKWIDGFNSFIRPELAQVSIFLLIGNAVFPKTVVLEGIVLEVVCAALGLFVGGRISPTGR